MDGAYFEYSTFYHSTEFNVLLFLNPGFKSVLLLAVNFQQLGF